jgi:tetratricopeptide (TPR) repeat protein
VRAAQIEPAVRALVAARLVLKRRDGCIHLREAEIDPVLGCLAGGGRAEEGEAPTRLGLLLRAASVLEPMQKDDDDVHCMADLNMHFARIDIWLRAGLYDVAYGVISSMEDLVYRWGSGVELRTQREAVRGRLGDDREGETMNLAALGDIYSYSDDFPSALAIYKAALRFAKEDQEREAIRRIYVSMGQMFWEHGYLVEAESHYRSALGLASEDDQDRGDRAAALTGLADCHQRHGNYRDAVGTALLAFEVASTIEPELAADVGLRLTHWYAELNQLTDALTMLARCTDLNLAGTNQSAWAALIDAKANLCLYRDRYGEALSAAKEAVDVARHHRDPINLRRSLTTLALTRVHLGDFSAARDAIEESARYRVAGVETVDLALRGIIAHRSRLPGTARDLFRQLLDETGKRTTADKNDLVAWDFSGIALCYPVLLGFAEPTTALEAFRRAGPESTERTPGLDDRVRFMVETMANGDSRLGPVLAELARIRPCSAG